MNMRKIISILLTVTIVTPFLITLCGWNLFLYTKIDDQDLIVASSQGLCHLALTEHQDIESSDPLVEEWLQNNNGIELSSGPFNFFTEQVHAPLSLFKFCYSPPDPYLNYRAIEFPWLLLLLIPGLALTMAFSHSGRATLTPQQASSRSQED